MPYPLPKGHEFSITYLKTTATHFMPVMSTSFDYYELSFLLAGDRKSVTPDAVYFMHTGTVTLTPPGLLHQTSSTKDGEYSRILIKFSLKIAQKMIAILGKKDFELLCDEHVLYFDRTHQEKISQLFFDMLEEYETGSNISEEILAGMLLRLLASMMRFKVNQAHSKLALKKDNPVISKALEYFNSHIAESPSRIEVATYVGLAPAYFSRLFKQITGTTYSDYQAITRLLAARTYIMQTELTLQEIAELTGFNNGNYLSNTFRNHFGMTPKQYKRKYADSDQYPD